MRKLFMQQSEVIPDGQFYMIGDAADTYRPFNYSKWGKIKSGFYGTAGHRFYYDADRRAGIPIGIQWGGRADNGGTADYWQRKINEALENTTQTPTQSTIKQQPPQGGYMWNPDIVQQEVQTPLVPITEIVAPTQTPIPPKTVWKYNSNNPYAGYTQDQWINMTNDQIINLDRNGRAAFQTFLKNQGYNIGATGVDGLIGRNTSAAMDFWRKKSNFTPLERVEITTPTTVTVQQPEETWAHTPKTLAKKILSGEITPQQGSKELIYHITKTPVRPKLLK